MRRNIQISNSRMVSSRLSITRISGRGSKVWSWTPHLGQDGNLSRRLSAEWVGRESIVSWEAKIYALV